MNLENISTKMFAKKRYFSLQYDIVIYGTTDPETARSGYRSIRDFQVLLAMISPWYPGLFRDCHFLFWSSTRFLTFSGPSPVLVRSSWYDISDIVLILIWAIWYRLYNIHVGYIIVVNIILVQSKTLFRSSRFETNFRFQKFLEISNFRALVVQ